MFRTIENFVSKPSVLILGAGASCDYGFPLWADLKILILQHCEKNPLPRIINGKSLLEISNALNAMDENSSIDRIATEFGVEVYAAFQILMGLILIEYEKTDLENKNIGWMETFTEKLSAFLIEQEKQDYNQAIKSMTNLRFMSLNYDRVFQQHVIEPLFEQLQSGFSNGNARKLDDRREFGLVQNTAIGVFTLFQPHGVIAQHTHSSGMGLNKTQPQDQGNKNQKIIGYGDVENYHTLVHSGWLPNIRVVDDFDRSDLSIHPTYRQCNSLLEKKRVFLAGLSEVGITNSCFQFSKASEVGLSLESKQLKQETKKFVGTRILENERSIRLNEFMKEIPLK